MSIGTGVHGQGGSPAQRRYKACEIEPFGLLQLRTDFRFLLPLPPFRCVSTASSPLPPSAACTSRSSCGPTPPPSAALWSGRPPAPMASWTGAEGGPTPQPTCCSASTTLPATTRQALRPMCCRPSLRRQYAPQPAGASEGVYCTGERPPITLPTGRWALVQVGDYYQGVRDTACRSSVYVPQDRIHPL